MTYLFGLSLPHIGIAAALGTAGVLHRHWWPGEGRTGKVMAKSVMVNLEDDGKADGTDGACVPGPVELELPAALQLTHVISVFCPGACTPIYNLDGFKRATYEEKLATRHHYYTTFPYRKQSMRDPTSHTPPDWSNYEKWLQCRVLPGGSIPGQLSSYGQEQMYCLGLSLRDHYKDYLPLTSFDPSDVYVTSTNVQRNVVSARCVLAGLFGKEPLTQSAKNRNPAIIHVEDRSPYDILTLDTRGCCLLQKMNLAAKNLHGGTPDMRTDRDEIESHINEVQARRLMAVAAAQEKFEKFCQDADLSCVEPDRTKELALNGEQRLYTRDERLHALLSARHDATDKVEQFWHNVFSNHPFLSQQISGEDFKALEYLRRIEIEDFDLMFEKGTRYKFYFDINPYFYNQLLVKEIFSTKDPNVPTSKSTPIHWKPCFRLYPPRQEVRDCGDKEAEPATDCLLCDGWEGERSEEEEEEEDGSSPRAKKKVCVCADGEKGPSFFAWYCQQNDQYEPMGVNLKHEAWAMPLRYYSPDSYSDREDNSRPSLDFLALRDNVAAREAHGYRYPKELRVFQGMAEENAGRILFYAATGQHELERSLVVKASVGRLLREILGKMLAVHGGQSLPPFHLYSCPHSMLTALLEALGTPIYEWPRNASDLRFELYKDINAEDTHYYVRVLYRGQEQTVRDQDEAWVHLDNLCRALRPFVADQTDYERTCQSSMLEKFIKCLLPPKEAKCRKEILTQIAQVPAGL